MRQHIQKQCYGILILLFIFLFGAQLVFAQAVEPNPSSKAVEAAAEPLKNEGHVRVTDENRRTGGTFQPLTGGIPGISDTGGGDRSLVDYLNTLFRFAIGIGALAAVLRITFAGIKYMTSEVSVSSKQSAIEDIQNSVLGLLLLLSVVIILQQINPDLLDLDFLDNAKDLTITNTVTEPNIIQKTQNTEVTKQQALSGEVSEFCGSIPEITAYVRDLSRSCPDGTKPMRTLYSDGKRQRIGDKGRAGNRCEQYACR